MERQPVTKLAKYQQEDTDLGALIDKRLATLQKAHSWNITREDPDIEAAAKNHAKKLIEVIIPANITRLEQRRMDLRAERFLYIREHAPELIAQARANESELAQERKVVERLSRDLQRGFTTHEVIERRKANLRVLEERKGVDLELKAGFELLSQPRQVEAEREVPRETAPSVEEQIPTSEESEEATFLPPLFQKLRPIIFSVENSKPSADDFVDFQLRKAENTVEGQRTIIQKQLLDDIVFIEGMSSESDYRRAINPQELHEVVLKVHEYIKTSPDREKTELSIEFKRGIVNFAGQYADSSRTVTKKGIKKAKKLLEDGNADQLTSDMISRLTEAASIKLRFLLLSSNPNKNFWIKVNKIDSNNLHLFQAGLALACYEIYQERNIKPWHKNFESWHLNKAQISEWYDGSRDLLLKFRQDDKVAILIDQLESAISSMGNKTPLNHSDKYALGNAISLQLKIGHLVDDINKKIAFIKTHNAGEAKLSRNADQAKIPYGDSIPSVLPQLDYITSMHEHKYNLDNTVGRKAQETYAVTPENRTLEQKQLLEDIAILSQFTTSVAYQDVFSPDELHQLVVKLQLLSQKNRPDFNEVEDKIIGILEDKARVDREKMSDHLIGISNRADKNTQNRKGMQWATLENLSSKASAFIKERMEVRASKEMLSYFIPVHDPKPETYPDLTSVYQLVTNMHALDVIGQRSIRVDKARQEAYIANCKVINDWFKGASDVISEIPDRPQLRKFVFQLIEMIQTMNKRLEGKQSIGFYKDYKSDPAGAISLQKKIGYAVEELKAELSALAGGKVDEDIIVPLE